MPASRREPGQCTRPRLAQSGSLTGQQWWVQSQCTGAAEGAMRDAQTAAKGLQTQGISLPTWETHRGMSVVPPGQHRRTTRRPSPERQKPEPRSPQPEGRPNTNGPKAPISPGARVSVIPSAMPWVSIRGTRFGARLSQPQHARARGEGSIFAAPRTRFGRAAAGTAALRSGLAEGLQPWICFGFRASDSGFGRSAPCVLSGCTREGAGHMGALAPAGQAGSGPVCGIGALRPSASGRRRSRLQSLMEAGVLRRGRWRELRHGTQTAFPVKAGWGHIHRLRRKN